MAGTSWEALIRIQARAGSAQPSVVAVEVLRSGWIGIYFQGKANSISCGIGCGGCEREREEEGMTPRFWAEQLEN